MMQRERLAEGLDGAIGRKVARSASGGRVVIIFVVRCVLCVVRSVIIILSIVDRVVIIHHRSLWSFLPGGRYEFYVSSPPSLL